MKQTSRERGNQSVDFFSPFMKLQNFHVAFALSILLVLAEVRLGMILPNLARSSNEDVPKNMLRGDTSSTSQRHLFDSKTFPVPTRTNHTLENFRVMLGIFTMVDSEKEFDRRKRIRDTYLNFYKAIGLKDVICSLQDLQSDPSRHQDCRLVYTFVVGAHSLHKSDIPTDLYPMESSVKPERTRPMLVDRKDVANATEEEDMVYLDIRENMDDGKSMSYFQYASAEILSQPQLSIDFVAKMDTDTVLYPDKFLDLLSTDLKDIGKSQQDGTDQLDMQKQNDRLSELVYGGYCQRPWNMRGEIYYLSSPLVHKIVQCSLTPSSPCWQIPWKMMHGRHGRRIEDLETALHVDEIGHMEKVHIIGHEVKTAWDHPVKEDERWDVFWDYAMFMARQKQNVLKLEQQKIGSSRQHCEINEMETIQKLQTWSLIPTLKPRYFKESLC